ncbi:MAG TPA: protein kinase, partial [Bryobacteraceae bacterium]|nr:protein kinase [Bryobacteraceae bacterium]
MVKCRSCSSDNPDAGRYCGSCGAPLVKTPPPSEIPTIAVVPGESPPTPVSTRGSSPRTPRSGPSRITSESIDEGRFPPGTLLADRYRIVDLVGRGGMGEVYRANDLKLNQPVALKFLPEALARDQRALERFHNEVRIGLQVSHRNVCRVYDIGEFEGQTYLSMEYVDGEDLGTLLRRIGRFPPDRALEIARSLCAGLAAAHEKGVLHRDLKPANVMINSRGEVRITDFGLAGLTDHIQGRDIRSGTPAYMAPEQLAGKEVSIKSDIYSLGLVLYEIFTGRRAFEASSLGELMRMQEQTTPVSLSSLVKEVDPAVERVILRCLDPDPRNRPSSALAVAAALPGGDPLAAALAAGETPSPDLVAAAGNTEGLSIRSAVLCMATVLIMLAAVVLLSNRVFLVNRTPFDNPPEILADKARTIVESMGYTQKPEDVVYGFHHDDDYVRYLVDRRHDPKRRLHLDTGRPPIIEFWYRQSPRYLRTDSVRTFGAVTMRVPPLERSGELTLMLDPAGRLLYFEAVPTQVEDKGQKPPALNWASLLSAAGLESEMCTSAEPTWIPPTAFDQRVAWSGTYPGAPEIPLRIEAASWQGRPVYFQIVAPWTRPERMEPRHQPGERVTQIAFLATFVLLITGACTLARRNWQLNRGDRRGAFRLAVFTMCVNLVVRISRASHVP